MSWNHLKPKLDFTVLCYSIFTKIFQFHRCFPRRSLTALWTLTWFSRKPLLNLVSGLTFEPIQCMVLDLDLMCFWTSSLKTSMRYGKQFINWKFIDWILWVEVYIPNLSPIYVPNLELFVISVLIRNAKLKHILITLISLYGQQNSITTSRLNLKSKSKFIHKNQIKINNQMHFSIISGVNWKKEIKLL